MTAGFYKRRRGILEHLEAGAISLLDLAVHDYLNLTANLVIGNGSSIPPGVCITSAVAIHATCPSQISERAIQRSLRHLKKIGWIKAWNVPGKRGNYPILVCRASVHDLSGKEYRVNGEGTSDWKQPALVAVGELSPHPSEADAKLSGDREVRTEKEKKQKHTSPAAIGVCEQIVALWNTERGPLPEVLKLTGGRRHKILARIQSDHEFPAKLSVAIQKARLTPFLCGAGGRGWKADFDWFIDNDTHYVAVLEGKYEGGRGGLGRAEKQTGDNLIAAGLPIN